MLGLRGKQTKLPLLGAQGAAILLGREAMAPGAANAPDAEKLGRHHAKRMRNACETQPKSDVLRETGEVLSGSPCIWQVVGPENSLG